MIISSFYKYVKIKNPEIFRRKHLDYCNKLKIKSNIIVAKEGINGLVSGTKEQIKIYEKYLVKNKLFKNIIFKHNTINSHPLKKTIVKVKEEIVTSKLKVNIKNKGKHVSPKDLNKLIEKEKIILLDTRNNYESKIGKFKNAIIPNINNFKEFKKLKKNLQKYKSEKIVMYCTGGVRCEKASAFLKESGFKNVFQLEGGIINYINKYPDKHFEGRCFVFDNRMSIPSGQKSEEINLCELCHASSNNYINCANLKCDKLFITCSDCSKKMKNTCSKKCLKLLK